MGAESRSEPTLGETLYEYDDLGLPEKLTDPNGKVVMNNREARSSGSDSTSYVYLWNLPTNQYGYDNNNGRILPTEEGLDDDNNTDNNEYGVWRARNYKYNSIYYNPNVLYRPWIGQDVNNNDFTDASINFAAGTSAIRLEPRDPTNTFDILANHSYDSTRVPQWDSNGGRETIGDALAVGRSLHWRAYQNQSG